MHWFYSSNVWILSLNFLLELLRCAAEPSSSSSSLFKDRSTEHTAGTRTGPVHTSRFLWRPRTETFWTDLTCVCVGGDKASTRSQIRTVYVPRLHNRSSLVTKRTKRQVDTGHQAGTESSASSQRLKSWFRKKRISLILNLEICSKFLSAVFSRKLHASVTLSFRLQYDSSWQSLFKLFR